MKAIRHAWLLVVLAWCLPLIALVPAAFSGDGRGLLWWAGQPAFQFAAKATLEQAVMVTIASALIGWLPGILAGLATSWICKTIQAICVFPILMPPFLWAIGWSYLGNRLPLAWQDLFDGRWGLLLTGLVPAISLVILGTSAAVRLVRSSEIDAALILCSPWQVRLRIATRLFPVAIGLGTMAALLGAADAGGGQIMGRHGLAGEVLVSIASRQAIGEAAAKAAAGLVFLSPLIFLTLWSFMRMTKALGQASATVARPEAIRTDWFLGLMIGILLLQFQAFPYLGLAQPLGRDITGQFMRDALMIWRESFPATIALSVIAGITATVGGTLLAQRIALFSRRRAFALGLCLIALSLPSTLRALGWLSLDIRVSQGWLVSGLLGIQWIPLAALLLTPALAAVPQGWRDQRALTQASLWSWARHAWLPATAPWLLVSALLTGLLALTDVTSLILMQPPGFRPFTAHLFAVMDNSMEVIVASLCVVLAIFPLLIGSFMLLVTAWTSRRSHTLT